VEYLITGGAGFLGRNLANRLLAEGHTVILLDDFSSSSVSNLSGLEKSKIKIINHDVEDPYDMSCDGIFNFACPASPIKYQQNPVKTIRTATLGVFNAVDLALRNRVPVLQASTSEVYGDPLIDPQSEDYWGNVNPIGIRSCYDEGKRIGETILTDYARQYSAEVKIARIFNTYGPYMAPDDGRVVSNFIMQALQDFPITIYGKGNQIRSFCFVDDTIKGVLKLFESKMDHRPVNIGNPHPLTMLELAKKIISLTNSNSKIDFFDLPGDDPKIRTPNIERAIEKLDWKPTTNIDDGLIKTIDYFSTFI
jgi:UDP-glucuronate decarboxylase